MTEAQGDIVIDELANLAAILEQQAADVEAAHAIIEVMGDRLEVIEHLTHAGAFGVAFVGAAAGFLILLKCRHLRNLW